MRVRLGPFQGDGADFGKRRCVIKALQPLQGGFANRTPAFSRRCSGLARRRRLRGGRPFSPRPSPGPAEQSNGKDAPERRRPARRSPPRRGAGCSECGGAGSRRPRGRGAEGRPSLPQGRFQREGAGAPAAKGPKRKGRQAQVQVHAQVHAHAQAQANFPQGLLHCRSPCFQSSSPSRCAPCGHCPQADVLIRPLSSRLA